MLRTFLDIAAYQSLYRFLPRTRILLACMPKSGSTFLSNAIGRLPGFRKTSLASHYGRTEQDLDLRRVIRKSRYDHICQHHVQYNEKTAEITRDFGISPVVLVRDLYDCTVSLRDHLRRESVENSMFFATDYHNDLSDDELETLIVHMAIPWYINFYVSWHECPSALWVTYQELTEDGSGVIERILRHVGREEILRSQIEDALEKREANADRVNIARAGRGESLSEENKMLIRQYCSFYPHIDFSRVGIR